MFPLVNPIGLQTFMSTQHQKVTVIITVTGTPGTGKTTVAENMGLETVHLTEYVKEKGLGEQKEEFEVDIDEMTEPVQNELQDIDEDGKVVVEGHLSHHVPSDLCIVLRTHPDELESRLKARDYSEEKIRENLEAEALDVILSEAVSMQENVLEIDTTNRKPEETVEIIREAVEKEETGYGDVDWSSWL